MEFRQLQHFLTAAQHGSLHAAADIAGVSQPALTRSIRRLETALGVRLFERHPRGVRLTVFGDALLLHARSLEAELRHARESIRELRSTSSGSIRLGAGPSMSASLVPRLTERLLEDGSAIRLYIRSGLNDSLLEALRNGEIDFAITTMPSAPIAGLVHQPLFTDKVVVAARRGHKLATENATMNDIARSRWIMPNRKVLTHIHLAELFHKHGHEGPDVWIETDFVPYLLDVIARTDLLSYIPARLMVGRRRLVALNVPGTTWWRAVSLSYWRRRAQTPASRHLMSVLHEVVRELHGG